MSDGSGGWSAAESTSPRTRACGSSPRELERADAVLVLGEDLTNTAPMLDLAVRTWLRLRPTPEEERNHGSPRWNDAGVARIQRREPSALCIAHTPPTKLDASPCRPTAPRPPTSRASASRWRTAGRARAGGPRPAARRVARWRGEIAAAFATAEPRRLVVVAGAERRAARRMLRARPQRRAWSLHTRGEPARRAARRSWCPSATAWA